MALPAEERFMNFIRFSTRACVVLIALCLTAAPSFAADAKKEKKDDSAAEASSAVGTVKGTVTLADGSAVADATVKLLATKAKPDRSKQGNANQKNGATNDGDNRSRSAKAKNAGPETAAEAKTDADGAFTLSDVPPGQYTLVVTTRGHGGMRLPMKVQAGGTVETTVKLKGRPNARTGNGGTRGR
jgi:hypothetical protein